MRKKLLSILLVLSLMLALVPAAFAVEPASGTCGAEGDGSNVTWTLDASGTLTFTGTGAIRDYASNAPPWRYSARYGRCRRGHYSPRCIYAGRQHSHIGQSAVHAHGR